MKSGVFSARTALRIIHKLHNQDPEARNRVGLGLVFRPGMPIFMTDHDGGVVSPQVAHINASHPTLTEVSISGKGLHKYYLGSALAGLDKGKLKFDFHGSKIEWFGWTGFSFLTGNVDPNQPAQLADGSALQAELMEAASVKIDRQSARSTSPGVTLPSGLRELPSTDQITSRARAYLDKVKPAVSGQHGHDATMYAACRLVLGFDLSPADALPLLEEWNARCSPPWSTSDLLRKLHEADKQSGPRGYLRDAALQARRGFSDADAPDMSDISFDRTRASTRANNPSIPSSNIIDGATAETIETKPRVKRSAKPASPQPSLSIPDLPTPPELIDLQHEIDMLRWGNIYPHLLDWFQSRLETIAASETLLPLHEAERRRLHEMLDAAKRQQRLELSGKHAPTIGIPCPNKICKSFHNERKHLFRIVEFDCGTWTCPACRVKLAAKWKTHLEDCMMHAERLYHGEIDPTTQYRTRTRKTRRGPEDKLEEFSPAWAATYKQMVRSARRASRTLDYRRVRIPGRLLLISTEPFTTADGTPAKPVDAAAAVWINQHEIDVIDTDRPISVSDGWKLPTETKAPQGWKSVGTFKNRIDDTYYSLAPILAAAVEKGLSLNDSGPLGMFVAARWDSAFRGDQSEAEALHRGILRSIDPGFSIDPAAPPGAEHDHPSKREKEPIPVF